MILHDAHNHLHHQRLAPHLADALTELARQPFGRAVVNGTHEGDWGDVSELSRRHPWIIPSFGVHPWYVPDCSQSWQDTLENLLSRHPNAAVGEIGLDRWIEGHDLEQQRPVFEAQLALAHQFARPVTIHCVRAWGALWEVLRTAPLPAQGFLLHAYSGPVEMTGGFIDRGASFSFSPYFLHERKAQQREIFQKLPADRLLVETDAPDLAPPLDRNPRPITDDEGKVINHPANIDLTYRALAELRNVEIEELSEQVSQNFARLFGRA